MQVPSDVRLSDLVNKHIKRSIVIFIDSFLFDSFDKKIEVQNSLASIQFNSLKFKSRFVHSTSGCN